MGESLKAKINNPGILGKGPAEGVKQGFGSLWHGNGFGQKLTFWLDKPNPPRKHSFPSKPFVGKATLFPKT